jgi:hypothetical protein
MLVGHPHNHSIWDLDMNLTGKINFMMQFTSLQVRDIQSCLCSAPAVLLSLHHDLQPWLLKGPLDAVLRKGMSLCNPGVQIQ